jgi:protein-S-isoprenylcysteine O-methyltransferase Ste14
MAPPGEFLARWRVRLGYPVALVYWWLAHPRPATIAGGVGIALVGLLVRGAAAGHLRKRAALATTGPYAWTRNPLYLGSALLAAGLLIAGSTWMGAVAVAVYFFAFYPAVMRREEAELRAQYGAAYEVYAARVPLFWPRRPLQGAPSPPFSWELYRDNREYQAALGFLAVLALLWVRMLWPV